MIAFMDPEPVAAVLVGEGHAAVVAILLGSAKEIASWGSRRGHDVDRKPLSGRHPFAASPPW
jgi:hypothetical protein